MTTKSPTHSVGRLFGGVFLTLDEYYPGEIVHDMHAQALKMLDKFLSTGLDPDVLKPDLVKWVNSKILYTVAEFNTLSGICSCGGLELAKWYVENSGAQCVGVHEKDELAFRWACRNGHLEVAQWFLKKYPETDIHSKNDYAFRWAFRSRHANVAKWLMKKCPQLKFPKRIEFEVLDTVKKRDYGNDICFEHPESLLLNVWPEDGEEFTKKRISKFLQKHNGRAMSEEQMEELLGNKHPGHAVLAVEEKRVCVLVFQR